MINMLAFLYKNRRINSLTIVGTAMMIMLFIGSISGSAMSAPKNLSFYFIIMATIFYQYQSVCFKINNCHTINQDDKDNRNHISL